VKAGMPETGAVSAAAVDHLIVAAATLAEGVDWCEAVLGVTPEAGGKHPLMGTHNRLLKIATRAYPDAYLEIIAVDPAAAPPTRTRWFGLDTLDLRGGPRLLHLVARSSVLALHRRSLVTLGLDPGAPVGASRETAQGTLAWQILVRDDGALLEKGAVPTLIQWQGRHPAEALPESGVTLEALTLHGVPKPVGALLRLPGVTLSADAGPALRARFRTPQGDVTLESTAGS